MFFKQFTPDWLFCFDMEKGRKVYSVDLFARTMASKGKIIHLRDYHLTRLVFMDLLPFQTNHYTTAPPLSRIILQIYIYLKLLSIEADPEVYLLTEKCLI